jgi:dTDP-4-dehydrorhamnose 3,5-epimerase
VKITKTPIEGILIIEPQIFRDARGYFFESYNQDKMVEAGIELNFVQDNQSLSKKAQLEDYIFRLHPLSKGNWLELCKVQ